MNSTFTVSHSFSDGDSITTQPLDILTIIIMLVSTSLETSITTSLVTDMETLAVPMATTSSPVISAKVWAIVT